MSRKIIKIDNSYARYAAAIFLTPPITSTIIVFFILLPAILANENSIDLSAFLMSVGFGSIIIYPGMLVVGIPMIIILRRFNLYKYWHYALAGASGGSIIALVISKDIFNPLILFFLIGGFLCASISWAFLFLPIKKAAD